MRESAHQRMPWSKVKELRIRSRTNFAQLQKLNLFSSGKRFQKIRDTIAFRHEPITMAIRQRHADNDGIRVRDRRAQRRDRGEVQIYPLHSRTPRRRLSPRGDRDVMSATGELTYDERPNSPVPPTTVTLFMSATPDRSNSLERSLYWEHDGLQAFCHEAGGLKCWLECTSQLTRPPKFTLDFTRER
jgi:hypothetical protein